jgi:hypothetical protein
MKEETVSPGWTLADKTMIYSLFLFPIVSNGIFKPVKDLPKNYRWALPFMLAIRWYSFLRPYGKQYAN